MTSFVRTSKYVATLSQGDNSKFNYNITPYYVNEDIVYYKKRNMYEIILITVKYGVYNENPIFKLIFINSVKDNLSIRIINDCFCSQIFPMRLTT